ncbi:hypothetical protein AGMMS50268_38480 [Spirochaetia bacterium]|nr:hypothetical protein AGMMS50268_38480 [Spirochaetia bacterium]
MSKIIPFPQSRPVDRSGAFWGEPAPDPMRIFNSFMQELEDNGVMDELRALPKKHRRINPAKKDAQ